MTKINYVLTLAATLVVATPAIAQQSDGSTTGSTGTAATESTKAAPSARQLMAPKLEIQRLRALDQRGINVFETPKQDNVQYEGFKLAWGAAFAQQFQGLDHSNTSTKPLVRIGHGFNNASANLYMNAQLAPGIRVALTSYLSSRHHNETWVKDG